MSMRNKFDSLIVGMLVAGLSAPAWADTDYQCLNACVNGGETSPACMTRCSYKTSGAETSNRNVKRKGYEQFSVPVPTNKIVVPNAKDNNVSNTRKDFACFDQCLKQGLQYQLCEEKCALK